MLEALWSFLRRSPQGPAPFPWERCYDTSSYMLYYKNTVDGTLMVDLRSRVDIGDGLYHKNRWWHCVAGGIGNHNNPNHHRNVSISESESEPESESESESESDSESASDPIVITASCCGPLFYLVVGKKIELCPICDALISYQD